MPQMRNRINIPEFSSAGRRLLPVACWLLALFSTPVVADWYQVEVVLFAFTEPDAGGELWYENPGLPARGQTIGLVMGAADPEPGATTDPPREEDLKPYKALPEQDYRLAGVRRALVRSGAYRALLHVAWRQPGLGMSDVRAVHLENTRLERQAAQRAEPEPAPEPEEAGETPEYTSPVKVFDGTVRLRKSRFLHLDVDFAYFPDTLVQPGLEIPAAVAGHRRRLADYIRLTESRRIKTDELNYFDHPLFGLVVEVSRIEFPEPESTAPGQ